MKKTALLSLFILIFSICNAQYRENAKGAVMHQHKGFYLSMALGPNISSVSDKLSGSYDLVFSGTGAQFDLKLGGNIDENLILHATIISNSMTNPRIKNYGVSQHTTNEITINEAMIGGGVTYYVMPSNILLSGSIGLGNFSYINGTDDTNDSSDRGFSIQLKAGKEWAVSKNWGLGVALTYMKTALTNKPGGGVNEMMNSNNIGIMFTASLH